MKSEKDVLRNIGIRLTKLRIEKGFTSYEKFAVEYGLSRMHYWKMEKGQVNITVRSLLHLLSIHKLSIEEFFALPVEETNKPTKKIKP